MLAAIVAASLFAVPVFAGQMYETGSASASEAKDVVDTAAASPDHKTLVAAVTAAGLVETLKGEGPFTVFAPTDEAFGKLPAQLAAEYGVVLALGNGFILTAMLWGAIGAHLADRKLGRAAIFVFLCAGLSLFGVIHSVDASGQLYLPWSLEQDLPLRIAAGYAAFGGLLAVFGLTGRRPTGDGAAA